MGRETITKERALCIRNRKRVLLRRDPVPKRGNVTQLFLRRQFVEPRRRNRNSLCHRRSIASALGRRNAWGRAGDSHALLMRGVRLTIVAISCGGKPWR
jgi:hypothetical protein